MSQANKPVCGHEDEFEESEKSEDAKEQKGCDHEDESGDGDDGFDPFGMGSLLDDHMDCDVSEEEMTKRVADAVAMGARLGGNTPGGIISELGELMKPKLRWEDYICLVKQKRKQQSKNKNDWNTPRRKPLFSGIYSPTRKDYHMNILFGYDCSGSMSDKQIVHGISQLQILDEKANIWVVPWDASAFFEHAKLLRGASIKDLSEIKRVGGGGTLICPIFKQYEEEIGPVDLIIIASDMYVADAGELQAMKKPDAEVIFLNVNGDPKFKYPFGRVFNLNNE